MLYVSKGAKNFGTHHQICAINTDRRLYNISNNNINNTFNIIIHKIEKKNNWKRKKRNKESIKCCFSQQVCFLK